MMAEYWPKEPYKLGIKIILLLCYRKGEAREFKTKG